VRARRVLSEMRLTAWPLQVTQAACHASEQFRM
jgi:hypothetical protein